MPQVGHKSTCGGAAAGDMWSSAGMTLHVGISGQVLHRQECNSILMQGNSYDTLHPCM